MKALFKFLFGEPASPVDVMHPGIRTTHPPTSISFCEWCKEFKVSMLHGRHTTHISVN